MQTRDGFNSCDKSIRNRMIYDSFTDRLTINLIPSIKYEYNMNAGAFINLYNVIFFQTIEIEVGYISCNEHHHHNYRK